MKQIFRRRISTKGWKTPFMPDQFRGVTLTTDLINAKTGKAIAKEGDKITPRKAKKFVDHFGGRVSREGPLGPGMAVDAAFIVEIRARFQDFLIKRALYIGRNHTVILHPVAFQGGDFFLLLHVGI